MTLQSKWTKTGEDIQVPLSGLQPLQIQGLY